MLIMFQPIDKIFLQILFHVVSVYETQGTRYDLQDED